MPADERIGLDIREGVPPREHAAQNHHNQSRGIIGPARPQLPLLEEGKLLWQKEVLGCQPGPNTVFEVTLVGEERTWRVTAPRVVEWRAQQAA